MSLLALCIRPCTLQYIGMAPRPDWWIEVMQEKIFSILDGIPAIEGSMMSAGVGGAHEQLEFIRDFVQLIGDVYTNAACRLPVIPLFSRDCQDDDQADSPNYSDYVKFIRKVRPQVDHVCRQGGLASILKTISMFGLEAENQSKAYVKSSLIEFACMFDQEFHSFETLEWVEVHECIQYEMDYLARGGVSMEYFHEIKFFLHWPDIGTSKRLKVSFFENLDCPHMYGWFLVKLIEQLPNKEDPSECMQSQCLRKHNVTDSSEDHEFRSYFRQTMQSFFNSAQHHD